MYLKRVVDPRPGLLFSGENNRKIGAVVLKDKWKGFPIYYLTLEERATCPRDCALFKSCYGNHMHLAKRFQHGAELEKHIYRDLRRLHKEHPRGFVVRLHVLGDFYSVDYVNKWQRWLNAFSSLHVFGYTAWKPSSPIGSAINCIRQDWDRFAVRFSNSYDRPATTTVKNVQDVFDSWKTKDVVMCPVQTGRSESCGSCALCWSAPRKTIGFIHH